MTQRALRSLPATPWPRSRRDPALGLAAYCTSLTDLVHHYLLGVEHRLGPGHARMLPLSASYQPQPQNFFLCSSSAIFFASFLLPCIATVFSLTLC